ncbi:MAG: hypothetical protein F6K14_11890 [Symploca sp. SIO2C1]|nr:hypothetical protein [Symploca sp. SIO2C1]
MNEEQLYQLMRLDKYEYDCFMNKLEHLHKLGVSQVTSPIFTLLAKLRRISPKTSQFIMEDLERIAAEDDAF